MRKLLLFILLIISILVFINLTLITEKSQIASIAATTPVKLVTFSFNEMLIPGASTTMIKFTVLLPKTRNNRQKILNIKYSPQPIKVFEANNNKYAYYEFYNPVNPINVKITVDAELYEYSLNKAMAAKKKDFDNIQSLLENVKNEKSIEINSPAVQAVARSIKATGDLDTIQKIFNYTATNITFNGYNPVSDGAAKAIINKGGDCSEFADVFVALCRAKGIPARVIYGYTTNYPDTPKHAWVEAYTKQYGWVPFDPTWGRFDLKKFSAMANKYIYLSYSRNDPLLNGCYYCYYHYYGSPIELQDSFTIENLK